MVCWVILSSPTKAGYAKHARDALKAGKWFPRTGQSHWHFAWKATSGESFVGKSDVWSSENTCGCVSKGCAHMKDNTVVLAQILVLPPGVVHWSKVFQDGGPLGREMLLLRGGNHSFLAENSNVMQQDRVSNWDSRCDRSWCVVWQ